MEMKLKKEKKMMKLVVEGPSRDFWGFCLMCFVLYSRKEKEKQKKKKR